MKYPIGIQSFESLRKENYVYVDKTEMVYELAERGKYYFLSRPRRFGKSLLVSTIEAYFSGRKDLFKGLVIDELEKDWECHPILHLDLNTERYNTVDSLTDKLEANLNDWEQLYGKNPVAKSFATRFEYVIRYAYEKTDHPVVILVDEYDKPMLQAIGNEELQNEYRWDFKRILWRPEVAGSLYTFALLTGVTKFGKVSVFSDLNNLQDLSMDARYQALCGMTEDEVVRCFGEPIRALAIKNKLSEEETLARLKKRYDGYHFVENGIGIYNPFSLLNTFERLQFGSYWFETGTPSYLVELLKRDDYVLPHLTEEVSTADVLNSIDVVSNNPISVLYQSGYLTIKDYNAESGNIDWAFLMRRWKKGSYAIFFLIILVCTM